MGDRKQPGDADRVRSDSDDERWILVERRRGAIRRFLAWAAAYEAAGESWRFGSRADLRRIRGVLDLFSEHWWGVVVYTCFDSETGATAAASRFRQPREETEARRAVDEIDFPARSVLGHRLRPGVSGAKAALVAACAHADEFRNILMGDASFDDRYQRLLALGMPQWKRTTCFDLLTRASLLGRPKRCYHPRFAYLDGSTGPASGFEAVWGTAVRRRNTAECEALLHWWTANWTAVTAEVGVHWACTPLDSADLENYLCIFTKRGGEGCAPTEPGPRDNCEAPRRRRSGKVC